MNSNVDQVIADQVEFAEPVVQGKGEIRQPARGADILPGRAHLAYDRVLDNVLDVVDQPGDLQGPAVEQAAEHHNNQKHQAVDLPAGDPRFFARTALT